jgi:hypothetical protein
MQSGQRASRKAPLQKAAERAKVSQDYCGSCRLAICFRRRGEAPTRSSIYDSDRIKMLGPSHIVVFQTLIGCALVFATLTSFATTAAAACPPVSGDRQMSPALRHQPTDRSPRLHFPEGQLRCHEMREMRGHARHLSGREGRSDAWMPQLRAAGGVHRVREKFRPARRRLLLRIRARRANSARRVAPIRPWGAAGRARIPTGPAATT